MSPFQYGLVGIAVLLLLIFLRMPVGFAMAFTGGVGMCIVAGINPAFSLISNEPFSVASRYIYSSIPLFIFMGYLASRTRLSADAFYTLHKWIGNLRGGLAMGTVGACAIFAAICGDPISTAATVSTVALPEMRKYGYSDQLSLGTIAASGNLGFLIPPSLVFIIYGILTEQSIGSLFISGIIPGLILALSFMATVFGICSFNPGMAPRTPGVSWNERIRATPHIFGALMVIVLVLGGIYTGIFTPTEAGAVGVFGIVLITIIRRQLTWKGFNTAIGESAVMTGMIFILIIGAMIFSRFLVITQVPSGLANYISGLDVAPIVVLIAVLVMYILLGFVMDVMSIIIVSVPILHPLLVGLGFDPVWLAVLTVITVLIGNITPPVGIVVFALAGMVRDVPLFTIFRGVIPFLVVMAVCLVLFVAFPEISLWLPGMMSPS
ncbi:MAG: TRAP transporter large permease [Dehalococcoidales bacterium]|nr:TRAP transporter large permease [Dehalococcoidales bacterium]